MLTPEEQMQILKDAITQGSNVPVFKLIDQANVQKGQSAQTEAQQSQGLRGSDGNTAMSFPESKGDFNTKGMDFSIDVRKYDREGNLVRSYDKVPPGVKSLNMGEDEGTVVETPSQYQEGGFNTEDDTIIYPPGDSEHEYTPYNKEILDIRPKLQKKGLYNVENEDLQKAWEWEKNEKQIQKYRHTNRDQVARSGGVKQYHNGGIGPGHPHNQGPVTQKYIDKLDAMDGGTEELAQNLEIETHNNQTYNGSTIDYGSDISRYGLHPNVLPNYEYNPYEYTDAIREADPEPSTFKKITNTLANPLATWSYSIRHQPIPWGRVGTDDNSFDMATGVFNPFKWGEYLGHASDDVKEGDYLGAAGNLLAAAPGIPSSIAGVKYLKSTKNLKIPVKGDKTLARGTKTNQYGQVKTSFDDKLTTTVTKSKNGDLVETTGQVGNFNINYSNTGRDQIVMIRKAGTQTTGKNEMVLAKLDDVGGAPNYQLDMDMPIPSDAGRSMILLSEYIPKGSLVQSSGSLSLDSYKFIINNSKKGKFTLEDLGGTKLNTMAKQHSGKYTNNNLLSKYDAEASAAEINKMLKGTNIKDKAKVITHSRPNANGKYVNIFEVEGPNLGLRFNYREGGLRQFKKGGVKQYQNGGFNIKDFMSQFDTTQFLPKKEMSRSEMLRRQRFQESSFNSNAKNKYSGAMGIAQFMPNTITEMKNKGFVESDFNPYNASQSVDAQDKYMKWMSERPYIKGDKKTKQAKTLAGYNMGGNRLRVILNKMKADGIDINNNEEWLKELPNYHRHKKTNKPIYESSEYVNRILYGEGDFEKEYSKGLNKPGTSPLIKKRGGYKSNSY